MDNIEKNVTQGEEKLKRVLEIFKKETKKRCYEIQLIEGEPDILDNKIGGIPYLPKGEKIPVDSYGNKMPLILQINLKNIDLPNYPKDGILEIYANMEYSPSDYEVRYYKEGLEYDKELELYIPEFNIVNKPQKIQLTESFCYMPASDFRFMETIQNIVNREFGKTNEMLYKVFGVQNWQYKFFYPEGLKPKITFGGYADFVQEDPRDYEDQNLEECILKIDSNLEDNINIGANGILSCIISKENLKNLSFKDAQVIWDC